MVLHATAKTGSLPKVAPPVRGTLHCNKEARPGHLQDSMESPLSPVEWSVHVDKLKPCVEPLTQPSEPDCQDEPRDDNSSVDMPTTVQRPWRVTQLPARYRN